ncbi:hypothetical protein [Methyloceanibacter marginalis]|uniref:hypothetical protein n=1 Tax=Methyloceanibacter marginalis TaxID=1774971 RepID=UPI000B129842|nr:hypothetical protein [Methyloceanibacter marginalis]
MARKGQADKVGFAPILDPRAGDIEDDASSTKRRSMLSLAGSLLVEISLPKLIVAWILLLVVPGLLLGLAPLVISSWFGMVVNKVASAFIGIWSALLFVGVVAVGWYGWRTLFRMIEKNFWALNSIVVQPAMPRLERSCVTSPRSSLPRPRAREPARGYAPRPLRLPGSSSRASPFSSCGSSGRAPISSDTSPR